MRARTVFLIAILFELIWLTGIFAAPYLSSKGVDVLSSGIYRVYRVVCHQRFERSFLFHGEKMAVCARCLGIYLGCLIGTLAMPVYQKIKKIGFIDPKLVIVALIPLSLDGFTQLVGLRESTNPLRLATGFIFGVVFVSYFIPRVLVRMGGSE